MPRKSDQSVHQLGLSAAAQQRLERRRNTPKEARAEVAKAEAFIDTAVRQAEIFAADMDAKVAPVKDTITGLPVAAEKPAKAPRSTRKAPSYTFSEAELREAREGGNGRSWADVAKMLGLPNPGAARKAWADITGTSHTEARALVGRATRGASASAKLVTPKWDASANGDDVIASLQGSQITVRSSLYGNTSTETLNVAFVTEYDESGDEPVVTFVEGVMHKGKDGENLLDDKKSTGATRTVAISRIVEVR